MTKSGTGMPRFFDRPTVVDDFANLAERVDGKSCKRQKYCEADKRGEQNGQNLFGHQR